MCCCYWEIDAHVVLPLCFFASFLLCSLNLDGVHVTSHSTNNCYGEGGRVTWRDCSTANIPNWWLSGICMDFCLERLSQNCGWDEHPLDVKGAPWPAEGGGGRFWIYKQFPSHTKKTHTTFFCVNPTGMGAMKMSWTFSGDATEPNVDRGWKSVWHDCTSSSLWFSTVPSSAASMIR